MVAIEWILRIDSLQRSLNEEPKISVWSHPIGDVKNGSTWMASPLNLQRLPRAPWWERLWGQEGKECAWQVEMFAWAEEPVLHLLTLDLGKDGITGNIKDINMEAGILGRCISSISQCILKLPQLPSDNRDLSIMVAPWSKLIHLQKTSGVFKGKVVFLQV